MQHPIHFLTTACVALFSVASAPADEIHVPDDVPWIVGAITLAVDGDVIIVHPGTYSENINMQGKAITLRSLDPNDPAIVTSTIISAPSMYATITCENDESTDTIINGFVITHDSQYEGSGGLHNVSVCPTVMNCIFICNHAVAPYHGGGIYNYESSPRVINCTFSQNSSDLGGGIYCTSNSNPIITNCVIINNDGGGIYSSSSNPILTSTRVCGNSSEQIRGGYTDNGGNTVSDYCPPPAPIGACCIGEGCVDLKSPECDELGGAYLGDNEFCFNVTCPEPCPGDITGDGQVNVDDIFAILGLWGVCP